MATKLYNQPGEARFLPGHPMAGKESGGAALAEASLFQNAMWLFTPALTRNRRVETEFRAWVAKFGARTIDLDPARHDEICAWVSHLPQMLSTALAALLEETFAADPCAGKRSPPSEAARCARRRAWVPAPTACGATSRSRTRSPSPQHLHALEQRFAHVRENLRTPELKEEFRLANEFRKRANSIRAIEHFVCLTASR